ncbi:MAG: hypothetical protein HGA96_17255 [Desulfobulbaceae bacterium]|nr:hypothetical protein [Desulfobulbaceae bacterium]
MIILISGLTLLIIGGLVSVLFWLPGLINRAQLRELLGSRYPLVYLVYSANGPFLLLAGMVLLYKYFHAG